ncbi:MFS transporter [Pseudomonas sp. PS1(2021)]|uniref:MFS transporter n=1 Tax=Pseudomonas sp. PS1(2021) TaxID=2866282 RepID=UPI001CF045AA|nr:MFS transporter [Pseudomonas sp. PS1(2021)]UCM29544.1 MFS transporter [Pseudomonas sp. PS1(2021)]
MTPAKKAVTTVWRPPAPLRLLLGTQFGLFFIGNGMSQIGTWMQRLACGWLVWEWTHSAFWLGILAAGDLLPVLAVGPFAGVLADRWDRLRLNLLAQIASVLLAVLTALLLAVGHLGLVGLVLLVTAQGTLAAAIQPARLAMVQQMVPVQSMGMAVALNSVNVNLARLLGPAAAGAMILQVDVLWVFVLNAVFTLALVFILARLRLAQAAPRVDVQGFFAEMLEGFAYIGRERALGLILLVMLGGGVLVRAMIELIPAIAAKTFAANAMGLAVLSGASAIGAVVSSLARGTARADNLLRGVLPWWGAGAMGAVLLTQVQSPILAVLAAGLIGFSVTRSLVSTQIFVQLTTPQVLRGRVLSVHGLIARGSPALGALVIGYAADRVGLAAAVEVSSGALVICLLVVLPMIRRAANKLRNFQY